MRDCSDFLAENINSIIIRISGDDTLLYINSFAEKFFGILRHECIGKNISSAVGGDDGFLKMLTLMHSQSNASILIENEIGRSGGFKEMIAWSNRILFTENNFIKEIIFAGNEININILNMT